MAADSARLAELEEQEKDLSERVLKIMMTIPNIIDPSVPIGRDDSENVEVRRYGEPKVPDSRFPTTRRSWSVFTASIWTARGRWPATAFII